MRLPREWETFLIPFFDLKKFYSQLDNFIAAFPDLMPARENIFHVFEFMTPEEVRVVLFGEDPYPRQTSACGVAFWDLEIDDWQKKTHGNALKNILKALLVARGLARYDNDIAECRRITKEHQLPAPPELFRLWLGQGILLVNSALTFSGKEEKKKHFHFWHPFHLALIQALNNRHLSPYYILWGAKAQRWENAIRASVDDPERIIKQGHPTFIHQFLDKGKPGFSPFTEIMTKTGLKWI